MSEKAHSNFDYEIVEEYVSKKHFYTFNCISCSKRCAITYEDAQPNYHCKRCDHEYYFCNDKLYAQKLSLDEIFVKITRNAFLIALPFVMIGGVIWGISSCVLNVRKSYFSPEAIERKMQEQQKESAKNIAKNHVTLILVNLYGHSPSSISFHYSWDIKDNGNGIFTVNSYVEYPNQFNVKKLESFTVKVDINNSKVISHYPYW